MLDVRATLERIAQGFEQEGEAFLAEGQKFKQLADALEASRDRCLTTTMLESVVTYRRRRASDCANKATDRVQAAVAIRLAMEAWAREVAR
jgi:hypothetical protein